MLDKILLYLLNLSVLIASNNLIVPKASEFAVYSGVSKLTCT